jgi:hypothetical protein
MLAEFAETGAENSIYDILYFHVKARKIGLVQAPVALYSREDAKKREERQG